MVAMSFTPMQARLGPARPPFLLLTLSCVSLGVGLGWPAVVHDAFWWMHVCLVLLGGLAAHISVNALNEYMDFKVGLDQTTQRTPFSGGSGVLPLRPDLAGYALALGAGALLCTVLIGGYFLVAVPAARMPLLLLGGLGVLLVAAYTPWLTRRPWLCLVAPGLGFGPAMVLGTQVVLTGQWTASGAAASLLPFFMVNNLLLLNQFPDVEPDRRAGRLTLPMLLGLQGGVAVIAWQWGLAFALAPLAVLGGLWPASTLLVLLMAPVAAWACRLLLTYARRPKGVVPPCMGVNVALTLVSPLVLALGLLIG